MILAVAILRNVSNRLKQTEPEEQALKFVVMLMGNKLSIKHCAFIERIFPNRRTMQSEHISV